MKKNREEMIPQVVEDRLQAAYEQIRKGEIKQVKGRKGEIRQMKRGNRTYKNWIGAAAVLVLVILIPSAVYAAVTYFQKIEHIIRYYFIYNIRVSVNVIIQKVLVIYNFARLVYFTRKQLCQFKSQFLYAARSFKLVRKLFQLRVNVQHFFKNLMIIS